MSLKQHEKSLEQGQALLAAFAKQLYSALGTARLDLTEDLKVFCRFHEDGREHQSNAVATVDEAIRVGVAEIYVIVLEKLINTGRGPERGGTVADIAQPSGQAGDGRFRSKERKVTVGVTMPTCLKNHLSNLAADEERTFSEVSRGLAIYGFKDFEERSYGLSSVALFSLLSSEMEKWRRSETEQVMLRLEPSYAIRLRAAAKEYRKSASEFSALCVVHGMEMQQQLAVLEVRISKCKGPAVRSLLSKIGLESYAAPLISGVLRGSVTAPKWIKRELASFFETTEVALSELFLRSFSNKAVPAFKAPDGKPTVCISATPWEQAVRSLDLPAEQEKVLLNTDR